MSATPTESSIYANAVALAASQLASIFRDGDVCAVKLVPCGGRWIEVSLTLAWADPPRLPASPYDFTPAETA